jgi:hypothetical protein
MPRFKSNCHLDLNLFCLGLHLGKPRGVDPSYYVRLKINSRSCFQFVKGFPSPLPNLTAHRDRYPYTDSPAVRDWEKGLVGVYPVGD